MITGKMAEESTLHICKSTIISRFGHYVTVQFVIIEQVETPYVLQQVQSFALRLAGLDNRPPGLNALLTEAQQANINYNKSMG